MIITRKTYDLNFSKNNYTCLDKRINYSRSEFEFELLILFNVNLISRIQTLGHDYTQYHNLFATFDLISKVIKMKAVTNRTIVLAVKNVAYSLITAHII